MDRIRININRKRSFAGCLFRRSVFVNGKPSPDVKNGDSTSFSVKRERMLFIQGDSSIRNNAVVFTSGEEEIGLDIRLVGDMGKGYRTIFCPEGGSVPLPSLSFERMLDGLEGRCALNEKQRKLALLVFVMEAFDAEEVLRSKHAKEVIPVLKSMGADLYASTLERVIASQFINFELPVAGGEDDESLAERFRKAEEAFTEADENYRLTEELSRTAANYITANYSELFTEEDVYRFDGGYDHRCFGGSDARSAEQPKAGPNKKKLIKLALATLIFLAAAAGMFALWRHAAYYPARAALENNTRTVVMAPELVKRQASHERPGGSSYIRFIGADGKSCYLDWGNVPHNGMSADEFIEAVEKELTLTLVVKGEEQVCAVAGEETTYIGVEQFNRYQKTQSVIGTILIVFFALIALITYAGVMLAIRWSE